MIKPAYSVSFLLSINIFIWQKVLYFPIDLSTSKKSLTNGAEIVRIETRDKREVARNFAILGVAISTSGKGGNGDGKHSVPYKMTLKNYVFKVAFLMVISFLYKGVNFLASLIVRHYGGRMDQVTLSVS